MDRITDLQYLAGRFRATEAAAIARGDDELTPHGTRPVDAEGWPAGPYAWELRGAFGDISTFRHLGARAAFVVSPPARDWETWLNLLVGSRYRLILFGEGALEHEIEAEQPNATLSIRGVWRMSALLCELLADDSVFNAAVPLRLLSEEWCELAQDFAALPNTRERDHPHPMTCWYEPPEWSVFNSTPEAQAAFLCLASRGATLLGRPEPENWRAWLDHLRTATPWAWQSGPGQALLTHEHLAASVAACEHQRAEAFRREGLLTYVVAPQAAGPSPAPHTLAPLTSVHLTPAMETPAPTAVNGRPQSYPDTLAYAMERCGLSPRQLADAVAREVDANAARLEKRPGALPARECSLSTRTVERWLKEGRMPRREYRPAIVDVLNAREGFDFHEIFPLHLKGRPGTGRSQADAKAS
jgi:hypothetical protein